MRKRTIAALVALFPCLLFAQQVNIDNILKAGKNKPFKFSGGISAGVTSYTGNEPS